MVHCPLRIVLFLEGLVSEAVLQLTDRTIVGHASRVTGRLNPHVLSAPAIIKHLEDLRLPAAIGWLGDDPESAVCDFDFFGHAL
jgi:hypothetical protein